MKIGKTKLFALAFLSAICFTAQADVISDFQSGVPLDKTIETALNQGVPFSKIVTPLILQAGANPISVTKAAIKASKNNKNAQEDEKLHSEQVDIMVAAILSKPEQAPEILIAVLENFGEISIDNVALLTISATVLVPELEKEILKVSSQINTKITDRVNLIKTTTFQNGFYESEDYTLSRNTGGNMIITITGGQISVSPNR